MTFYTAPDNSSYIEELFNAYVQSPKSVPLEWQHFFESLEDHFEGHIDSHIEGQTDAPYSTSESLNGGGSPKNYALNDGRSYTAQSLKTFAKGSLRTMALARNYWVRGHLYSHLDPLHLTQKPPYAELDPEFYGFIHENAQNQTSLTPLHDHTPFFVDGLLGLEVASFQEVLQKLQHIYCGSIGAEFMHIQDIKRRHFIQESLEINNFKLSPEQEKTILGHILEAELFEQFLHTKFPGAKRFGLDGGESLIPALHFIIQNVCENSSSLSSPVSHIVLGMAHRGRLNVLTNLLKKPYANLFAQFLGNTHDPHAVGSGDVKYHLGYSHDMDLGSGRSVHLSLMSNPSHLEAINPVVLGKVRAEQLALNDTQRQKVMGILIHGDAAFAGQGLVAETLELSDLGGYRTGGTLHIIINNQIGFTTSPPHSRSSPYCSDVAKVIQAPILHVNGDDPYAVMRACFIACEYRKTFSQDIVLDLICYRRFGHNEADEPSFTQPLMYKAIKNHPHVSAIYEKNLMEKGIIDDAFSKELKDSFQQKLSDAYTKAQNNDDCFEHPFWLKGSWQGITPIPEHETVQEPLPNTGVSAETLSSIGNVIFKVPKTLSKPHHESDTPFHLHPKIERQLLQKQTVMREGTSLDWATGEALAFGSLMLEGHYVRLSGQDCRRGTFSQRHAVFVDQENENTYIPLNELTPKNPLFDVVDSPLAEASVLGFEYGMSTALPKGLILWEAQFGDFANGAQVIIDQFLSSGTMKWARQSGLVMLLPHGFEGQGPEHSSARLERFLQLCAHGNWYVANCSTPAQYFHILRRQLKQSYRIPLILMTPKSLLRHPLCVSSLKEFEGVFEPVLTPPLKGASVNKNANAEKNSLHPEGVDPKTIQKVVLCSGKIFYDLLAYGKNLLKNQPKNTSSSVVLMRLEQFYPFPEEALKKALAPYKHCKVVWCQEEPENMGAWHFLDRRLEKVLSDGEAHATRPFVVARPPMCSPATGLLYRHEQKQLALCEEIFDVSPRTTSNTHHE